MTKQRAERGGIDRAEDNMVRPIKAVPAYGECGWRKVTPGLGDTCTTDASFRWLLYRHRDEFKDAGAIGVIANRVFVFEPTFSEVFLRIAQRNALALGESRLIRAQAEADDFVRAVALSDTRSEGPAHREADVGDCSPATSFGQGQHGP